MPKYTFFVPFSGGWTYEVEADNEDEAWDKVKAEAQADKRNIDVEPDMHNAEITEVQEDA